MYWDTLLGEYCYLAENIFFLRELEAYYNETRSQETERERQSMVDTPRVSVPDISAAQRLSSRPPKERPDSYPKSYPQENAWGDDDDD